MIRGKLTFAQQLLGLRGLLDFDGIFSSHDLRLSELLPSKGASNKDSWSLVCTTGEKVRVCGSCKTF